jgi:hypothetical protein
VSVFVENLSADASVAVTVSGELVDPAATCGGAGDVMYSMPLTCVGSGLVPCGTVSGLRPGTWVNHLSATVTASTFAQVQHRREVFISGGGDANALVWTIYPRTVVVGDTTAAALCAALAAASPGPSLVTFSLPGTPPQTIHLTADGCPAGTPGACPTGTAAALCITDSGIVIDALDAQARWGAVHLSVDQQPLSVLRVYGSDDVFRGLVFDGSQMSSLTQQMDTVAFTGALALRNRLEQSMVNGPTRGDTVSVDTSAGGEGDDANVVDACELRGAQDRGLKVTTGAHAVIRGSCVHDNQNGGVQATLGGHVVAVENLIQHNVPGGSQNGITVRGVSPCLSIPTYPNCDEPSTAETSGNIVRFHGGRGLTVTDNAVASFADDYVADNEIIGSKVETTHHPMAAGESTGKMPMATFRGVALVCNRNAAVAVTNTCQPAGSDATPCGTDQDCCGLADGCCVTDAGCVTPLRCLPATTVQGFGASQAQAAGEPVPQVDYGTAAEPGQNAFARNVGSGGINFNVNVTDLTVEAEGNQWEHCGSIDPCDTSAVLTSDVRRATGANVLLGGPAAPWVGVPILAAVSPARPSRNDLVHVFGGPFDAIDGAACANQPAPDDPCSGANKAVEDQNSTGVTSIAILDASGASLTTVSPDAVTPTMLAFLMPFDCFAPLTLQVTKRHPNNATVSGTIALCDPAGCAGHPAGHPCDDGNPCTTGDRCDANGTCQPGERVVCAGSCLTGACDANVGCVPKPAGAACDDGDVCTAGDHCSGEGDVCVPGTPHECRGPCLTGACDPRTGCIPKAAGAACEDGDPCTTGDHCAGDRDVCVPGSAACDDGDPCTAGDVCTGGVCRGMPIRGFDGAICRVAKRPVAPICTAAGGSESFDRFASNRLRKADALLKRASGTPNLTVRDRLVRRTVGLLQEVAGAAARFRRSGRISRDCADAVKAAIGDLRHLVLALIV